MEMRKSIIILLCLYGYCCANPLAFKRNIPILQKEDEPTNIQSFDEEKPAPDMTMISTLTLPSNATSIRADITDNFSCENRLYGYYADVENECQIFHVCLPVTYADGKENTYRWSFICPEETVFNQESFTCMRQEDMTIDCVDSDKYYELNGNFGMTDEDINKEHNNNMVSANSENSPTPLSPQLAQEEATKGPSTSSGSDPEIASSKPKPIPNKQKPVRIPKPNRRKPAQSIHPQTKPVPIFPLRKMPTVASAPIKAIKVPVLEETSKLDVEPEASETAEVIIQPVKTLLLEKSPTSSVLKNIDSKPKPEILETNALEPEKLPLAEAPVENSVLANELQKETNLPSNDLPNDNAVVANKPQQEILLAPNESTNMNAGTSNHETEPKSQTLSIAEESTKTELTQQPIEVIEEIPAVISEIEISEPYVEEQLEQESAPLHVSEDIKTNEDIQSVEKIEQPLLPPSIFEDNSEEASPIFNAQTLEGTEPIEQDKNDEELKKVENVVPVSEKESPPKPDQQKENVMMEPTPEQTEDLKHTVGGFKPVDPVMAAEAEALITDFLNTLMKSESSNAKPIMPTDLAQQVSSTVTEGENTSSSVQEAEKTDKNKETEIKNSESNFNGSDIKSPSEVANVSQEQEAVKKEELLESENDLLPVTQDHHLKDLTKHPEDGTIEQLVEEEAALDKKEIVPQQLKIDASSSNTEPVSNIIMMNSFPAEMYQIPVKVIQTADESIQPIEKTEEEITTEQKLEPNVEIPVYKPISIDDIVELVKERLDQLPEKEKPIDLILQPVQEESVKIEKTSNPDVASEILESTATVDEIPLVNQDEKANLSLTDKEVDEPQSEEIILPIYHRTTGAEDNLLKTHEPQIPEMNEVNANTNIETHETVEKTTQTENIDNSVAEDKNEEGLVAPAVADSIETKVKSGRLYRSRSIKNAKMDPRKRRFLFRSDAS